MDFASSPTLLLALSGIFALAYLLKKLREAREALSEWTLESTAFKAYSKDRDAKVEKEAEATRNLIRDRMDEIQKSMVSRAEFAELKGRVKLQETLNKMQHGHQIPGESSTYSPGDPLP